MIAVLALFILASSLILQAKNQNGDERSAPVGITVFNGDELDSEALEDGLMKNLGLSSLPDLSKLSMTQEEVSKAFSDILSSAGEKIPEGEPRLWTLEASGMHRHASRSPNRHSFPFLERLICEARRNSGSEESLVLTFDLKEKAETEEMELSLWLARLARLDLEVESHEGERGYLDLHYLTNSSEELLETKQIGADVQGFDVTVPVTRHLKMASRRIVFNIRCRGCRVSGSTMHVLLVSEERSKSWKQDEEEQVDCPTDQQHLKCCRNKMTVFMKKFPQLNFILHPLEFEAYRCEGSCPNYFRSANNHAIVQSFVRQEDQKRRPLQFRPANNLAIVLGFICQQDLKAKKHTVTPKPCCIPKALKDLDPPNLLGRLQHRSKRGVEERHRRGLRLFQMLFVVFLLWCE
ncbi:unnamed protein product [Darwinula stevensoni]|uniref:TGF-beta family profile domain-containing protein n=1 Tax=Darwinula stevensoni TaxID=69355 RepID=A0A7R8XED8_9CRUS|nr:unnamed protein product [Darwinula stevensoni]CAG0894359.1 unnamed protein product [Darwinula stevensoni]